VVGVGVGDADLTGFLDYFQGRKFINPEGFVLEELGVMFNILMSQ
jgi:hypothetical protein